MVRVSGLLEEGLRLAARQRAAPDQSERRLLGKAVFAGSFLSPPPILQNHRITESQNSRGWKGPLWVI